jgi:CxxC motif-containing protein
MAVETRVMNCIMCPMGCELTVTIENGAVINVTGNTCPRGAKYANDEVTAPKRMLTTTVAVEGGVLPLLPVVSAAVLPKERVMDCARYLRGIKVQAPVKTGEVVVKDILGLGVDIIASRDI